MKACSLRSASGRCYYDAQTADYYHPGRSARAVLDGATVAQFGQIHPELAAARKLRQDVFVAEIYLDRLYQHDLRQVRYEALPRFPAVERDFSFVFDDGVEFEKIQQSVTGLGIAELRSFVPVEIFRGGSMSGSRLEIIRSCCGQSFSPASGPCATTRWRSGRNVLRKRWKRWAARRGYRAAYLANQRLLIVRIVPNPSNRWSAVTSVRSKTLAVAARMRSAGS